MSIEAMKQMVEALQMPCNYWNKTQFIKVQEAIEVGRKAIAEAEKQEPVALFECDISPRPLKHSLKVYHVAMSEGPLHFTWTDKPHRLVYDLISAVKYYATHPQPAQPKEWVGLTDKEIRQMCGSVPSIKDAVREAEAKLKEKNT